MTCPEGKIRIIKQFNDDPDALWEAYKANNPDHSDIHLEIYFDKLYSHCDAKTRLSTHGRRRLICPKMSGTQSPSASSSPKCQYREPQQFVHAEPASRIGLIQPLDGLGEICGFQITLPHFSWHH